MRRRPPELSRVFRLLRYDSSLPFAHPSPSVRCFAVLLIAIRAATTRFLFERAFGAMYMRLALSRDRLEYRFAMQIEFLRPADLKLRSMSRRASTLSSHRNCGPPHAMLDNGKTGHLPDSGIPEPHFREVARFQRYPCVKISANRNGCLRSRGCEIRGQASASRFPAVRSQAPATPIRVRALQTTSNEYLDANRFGSHAPDASS